ncbi:MAG: RidA family protein [Alphaproteobacteria bacterium]|nr:RidA family protein [Alphaproteobacteria bacterium]MCY4497093.1 RidA family protein [Rhodospirillaceae bacterium]
MGQNTVFTGKPWEQDVSHAPGNISTGKLLHISGITARLPDGSINGPADMRKQAEQIVQNIKDVCDAAGASIGSIVRLTIYTTDLDAFQEARDAIQELYVSRPAATLVEISRLASPDMVLEIEPTVEMDG